MVEQTAGSQPTSAAAAIPLSSEQRTITRGAFTATVHPMLTEKTSQGRSATVGRLIVGFREGVGDTQRLAVHNAAQTHGIQAARAVGHAGPQADLVDVSKGPSLDEAIKAYQARPEVSFVQPDFTLNTLEIPNDPLFSSQWGLSTIQAPSAWNSTHGAASRSIAILDCGIYDISSAYYGAGHPDINGKVVFHENLTASQYGADDFCDHGTHVAGIAAANTNNGVGGAGVGYNTSLMNIKVLDDTGSGTDSTVIQGIYDAANLGASVINMSLGGTGPCTPAMQSAINYAWSHNVVVVAAAGNDGTSNLHEPASCTHVVSVAATDQTDARASFSSWGSWVSVAAPGVSIESTNYTGGYEYLSGTSMAAPFVSGLAGLIWSTSYGTSNDTVVSRLLSTADPIPGTGSLWASGHVNASAAVGGPPTTTLPLSVSVLGNGSGLVTSAPAAINCGPVCNASFAQNATITLSASPAAGSTFGGWGGACSGVGACVVPMTQAQSVTATFNLNTMCSPRPQVSVSVTPGGPGVLQVVISTTGAGNVLQSLQFGSASNALIDIGTSIGRTGNFTQVTPPGAQSTTLTVRRATSGVATTVPLIVNDRCGAWSTLVGGGPTAF
jgi:thermitase